MVDAECIGAQRQPAQARRDTRLIKVRRRQPHLLRMLHHPARVHAVDTAAVVGMKRQRNPRTWPKRRATLGLPKSRVLQTGIPNVIAELVVPEPARQAQLALPKVQTLL